MYNFLTCYKFVITVTSAYFVFVAIFSLRFFLYALYTETALQQKLSETECDMHLTKISQEDADIVLYRNTYIVFQFSKQLENKPVNSFWRHGLEMKCQITNIG